MALMILGCTGMILLSGVLAQFLHTPLQQILGGRRMKTEIDKLEPHLIVIGSAASGYAGQGTEGGRRALRGARTG